ncbi:hypothetical protein [Kangiella shandongensis]|uniref:hypothetical protein n=1 Tax=Kangiella shandongensis TaxID=2763258 RepID=UPI001CBC282D|nr:hypothetical protein [Kangiella shandongensis]
MNNHLFYLRQLSHLLGKGTETGEALEQITQQTVSWQPVLQHYQQSQDLLASLEQLNDSDMSSFIENLKAGRELGLNDRDLLLHIESSTSSSLQINTIIKARLVRSLGYAALVAGIALIVLAIFYLYVLPVYQTVIYDQMTQSKSLMAHIDALTFNSWRSLYIYLPPVIIIVIFASIAFTPTKALPQSRLLSFIPMMKGLPRHSARVALIHQLNDFYVFLSRDKDTFKQQLNSNFFTSQSRWDFTQLFSAKERETIMALHQLDTFHQESGNLVTQVESDAIESISSQTNILAVIFHIAIIIIVAQIVMSIYQPIFQLGAGF